ncbi:DNA polymerase III subunit beta [Methylobacterium frigidaeris]|uniref:Beta sliding clamp n=2 Tax=Methylobacterium frigidaeris TaxID=2038277 RepID=A0AA37HFZ1_9HYPH|nr:DNA polymerase III subunit beta [Methylobacterium frigidaeris]GJD65148.1 Beta sliding clamp [Methylobacterium frigidaeris]
MLSLTIARSALLDALSSTAKVVEKRNTIPILSNVLLHAEGDTLAVTGTDLDIYLTTRVPATVTAAGSITLPAGALHDIARKLPGDAVVTIEDGGNGQVSVRAGRSRFTLGSLPASDFPAVLGMADSHAAEIAIAGGLLAKLLSRTAFAISNEETRYYLNGTFFVGVETPEGPALRAVATDGHRLARVQTSAASGVRTDVPGVIVPRKACGEISRLAEAAGEVDVRLVIMAARIQMTVGDTVLTSKLIDGTFPDYQRVIPTGNDRIALAPVEALSAAVARVGVIASERGRAVKLDLDGRGGLTVIMRNPEGGEAVETLDVEHEGAPFGIGLNGRFLADILEQVGGDTARLAFADPGSPVLIRPRQGDDALFVLMPMRVA